MTPFFNSVRQGFNRQKSNGSPASSPTTGIPPAAPAVSTGPPMYSRVPGSSSTLPSATPDNPTPEFTEPEQVKYFFREKYSKLGVRGNFLPLAIQPKHVDLGEWLAHQVHEQWRVLEKILECIQESDSNTKIPLCNPKTCPVMTGGRTHIYTWLNSNKEPVRVTAPHYISMVQKWIRGKIADERIFPIVIQPDSIALRNAGLNSPGAGNTPAGSGPNTPSTPGTRDWVGKATGFQENFLSDVKTIFRQMHRIYAHVYHSHWVDPFWHCINAEALTSGWTDLNACFCHFITVARLFGLLSERDMEPMKPLTDIWVANGSIPPDAAAGACTIVPPQ